MERQPHLLVVQSLWARTVSKSFARGEGMQPLRILRKRQHGICGQ
jgi:hypothetical protein